jgi:hypothetical protein
MYYRAPVSHDGDRRERDHSQAGVMSPESDKREITRDASAPYNHSETVLVASAWLAFYVIATIHAFIASGY